MRLYKKTRTKVLGLLLISFFLFACSDDDKKLTKQKPTPAFTLSTLDGGRLQFPDDTKGKIVAICFWADWCAFCKTELRDAQPIYKKYDKDLAILAINIRQDKETARAFLKNIDTSFDVLLDQDGKVTDDYSVTTLPMTFIIDRNGNLHTQILGEFTPEVLEGIIKELL